MNALVDEIDFLFGSPLNVISNTIRGMITARPGHDLIVCDYAQVEARGLAWLAGEEKVLEVFRSGGQVYCLAAEDVFGRPISKKDDPFEYSVGKVIVLACGYQGSVGAFQSMARNYNVKVADPEALKIVKAWRLKNPAIVQYWSDCEAAAIEALKQPGVASYAGPTERKVGYLKRGSFLFCRLPSGRMLSYPYPRLVPYVWISRQGKEEDERESKRIPAADLSKWLSRGWSQNGEPGPAIHYKYVDPVTKKWTEGPTYGGSLVENITQALCRDLLAEAMMRLSQYGEISMPTKHFWLIGDKPEGMSDAAYYAAMDAQRAEIAAARAHGYAIVMHVHDEIVCEVPEGWGSPEEMEAIMCEVPAWAQGFPIAAEGWRGKRYRK